VIVAAAEDVAVTVIVAVTDVDADALEVIVADTVDVKDALGVMVAATDELAVTVTVAITD
jgi:hypothetical protein